MKHSQENSLLESYQLLEMLEYLLKDAPRSLGPKLAEDNFASSEFPKEGLRITIKQIKRGILSVIDENNTENIKSAETSKKIVENNKIVETNGQYELADTAITANANAAILGREVQFRDKEPVSVSAPTIKQTSQLRQETRQAEELRTREERSRNATFKNSDPRQISKNLTSQIANRIQMLPFSPEE